jgi:hypothetical protein
VDHEKVVWWKLAANTEENAEAVEMQWMELAKERTHLDAEGTEDKVKQ